MLSLKLQKTEQNQIMQSFFTLLEKSISAEIAFQGIYFNNMFFSKQIIIVIIGSTPGAVYDAE